MADGWSEMRQDRPATKKLEPRSHCDKSNGYNVVTPSLSVARADMLTHASHLLHLQVKSIGHRVIAAVVHYLGSNIFVFILFYNLDLLHHPPPFLCFCLKRIVWSVKASKQV